MNPLEKYPHLFANGKFCFRDTHGWRWKFVGVSDRTLIGYIKEQKDVGKFHINNCTLIARPIEDISYKEMQQLLSYAGLSIDKYNARKSDLIAWAKQDTLCFQDARKILSIGVYPFDQSHFEDGTVINATNLKQTA